jgi:ABC-2 type transport system permease protein
VSTIFNPVTMLGLLVMIVLTSLAFNTMMFLLMVRIEDPLVPRAMFGILNTLLFFPSGAIYPIQAFPALVAGDRQGRPFYLRRGWLQVSAAERDDPGGGMGRHAVPDDLRRVTLGIAIPLFKRTL